MTFKLKYPVKNINISLSFGEVNTNHPERKDFYTLFNNKHPGIDFKVPVGTKVYSSYPGIVVRKEFHKGMGNTLGIRFGNIVTLYAHVSHFYVELGQEIIQEQLLGLSGNTGQACTNPHLHYEMRDISRSPLKNMVFDPPFNSNLRNLKETFIYKVNNTNNPKALEYLAKMYFGNTQDKYIKAITAVNPKLKHKSRNDILPQDLEVASPPAFSGGSLQISALGRLNETDDFCQSTDQPLADNHPDKSGWRIYCLRRKFVIIPNYLV